MKKIWAFIFVLLLILVLPACGEDEAGAVAGQTVSGGGTVPKTTTATTVPGEGEMPLLGTWEGNTYGNRYLGIACQLPESFVYSTREELLVKNGLDAETDVAELESIAANCQPVQVMYALDQAAHMNILITFQRAAADVLAEKDLKADLQAQLDDDIGIYESMGITGVRGEYTQLSVDGKALDALVLTGDNQGRGIVVMTIQYKSSNGLVTLTLSGTELRSLEQLLTAIRID